MRYHMGGGRRRGREGMGGAIPTIERTPLYVFGFGLLHHFYNTQHNTIIGHKYRAIIMGEGQASGKVSGGRQRQKANGRSHWQQANGRRQSAEGSWQKANGRRQTVEGRGHLLQ